METLVHTLKLRLNWKLIELLSRIDRFDASWASIEKKEGQSLKQLKSISTVRSVGASTRIEGSKLSDEQVETLLKQIDISKLADRDSQEVVGYYETMDFISESFDDLQINESNLKYLHQLLLKYSTKDAWHRGDYKTQTNAVEARLPDGSTQIIFQTTPPGVATISAMTELIKWYTDDKQTHPLVKCALFVYDFLSIHPFQDGNGRLSRLLTTLLLLKSNYKWIEYVSFENEVEHRKTEYYRVLRSCQVNRPGEDVTTWIEFFFDALGNIQDLLTDKLHMQGALASLSPREKSIITFIENRPGCKSGEISNQLNIPNPTVKRILAELVKQNLIQKHGVGPGTNYTIS
ncbi:Fic family protein [Balneolaceae bacterium ANBcel3]|nr:Fic family protein [Balneolaceae bacterium ANBcel3]